MKLTSNSLEETIGIGRDIGKKLKRGDCVALIGDLGAGKTMLTKGIAEGLGVKNPHYVNSPTFVVIKEYNGRWPLYHFDLYRIDKSTLFDMESYEEYFYGDGVSVVEWADKIENLLPENRIEVRMKVAGDTKRAIEIKLPSLRGSFKRRRSNP